MKKFLNLIFKKYKKTIPICLLIIMILVFIYGGVIKNLKINKQFVKDMEKIEQINEDKIFSIEKIILCSNANAVDNSNNSDLSKLNIYQYTDIAIYINNKNKSQDLNNENTVNELYIDNIQINTKSNQGKQSLKYKNILGFGSKETLSEYKYNDIINFNIIYNNKQEVDYNEPNFYTDCSNPITLEYINQDLEENNKLTINDNVSFDGKILNQAGIKKEDINAEIKLRINIKNNNNNSYSCWMNFDVPLDDIYNGNCIKSIVFDENNYQYNFFRSN